MEEQTSWVQGDGGPLIVLQRCAAECWRGAAGTSGDDGEYEESDLEAVCELPQDELILRRYDRDALVLMDSEWSGRMVRLDGGVIAVVQLYFVSETGPSILDRALEGEPWRSVPFNVEDDALRLLVAGDNGEGTQYGALDIPVTPGPRQCHLHVFDDGIVALIQPLAAEMPSAVETARSRRAISIRPHRQAA